MEALDTLNRRSRMVRRATDKRIELTDRDLAIFRLLDRYRYLRSTHIHALVGGKSHKRFIERLGDLYHDGGYLDRPVQQWQAINARYMPVVYELGEAGERVLAGQGYLDKSGSLLLRKGRTGASRQFHHELMICDILSSLEIGVRATSNLRLVSAEEILSKAPEATRALSNPFAVPVSVSHNVGGKVCNWDRPLIPAALFGIEYRVDERTAYRFFALEADRDTEPVLRHGLEQSSYLRKFLQYREIAARRMFKSHWGLPNLLVLTVTTNEQHMCNLMRLGEELSDGRGSTLFLFKTMPSRSSLGQAVLPTPQMLNESWKRSGADDFFLGKA